MKIEFDFHELASLPVGWQPSRVTYDFDQYRSTPAMLAVWLQHKLITQEQHDELLRRITVARGDVL